MQSLQCGAQSYAWGKPARESMVAKLLAGSADDQGKISQITGGDAEKRFAELWIGVHNSLPSKVVAASGNTCSAPSSSSANTASDSASPVLLKDFLAGHADQYLGAQHMRFYGGADTAAATTVPFLLKVLSIDMALSIQAHPTRALAKVLHARDPKNYPDPNHKPELIVALTPFEALCCFRPVAEMIYFIHQSPFVRAMVGERATAALEAAAVNEVIGTETKDDAKAAIRLALEHIYSVDRASLEAAVKGQVGAISSNTLLAVGGGASSSSFAAAPAAADNSSPDSNDSDVGAGSPLKAAGAQQGAGCNSNPLDAVHEVFVRTERLFPGDVGLWMMYFLNYLQLNVGDALFLGASEPHAYISGDGVEIMANSDNVVRAGLTPKFKDVETLLSMLTYDTNALSHSKYSLDATTSVQQYAPPSWCDDFSLFAVRLSRDGLKRHNKTTNDDEEETDAANINVNATTNVNGSATSATFELPSVGLGVCVAGKAVVTSAVDGSAATSSTVGFGSNFVLPLGKATFTLADGEDECTIFIGTTNVHGAMKKNASL